MKLAQVRHCFYKWAPQWSPFLLKLQLMRANLREILLQQQVSPTRFWLFSWSWALAITWVLPNHYSPWAGFHMDAVMACMLLIISFWFFVRDRASIPLTVFPLIACLVVLIIALQYAAGLILQAGNAWVGGAYVFGFLISWTLGYRWFRVSKWQAADGLFFAIGIASFLSVGLQLHQWLQLERLDIWAMGGGEFRPYGNMGQPNQLATLLLWGVLGVLWGVFRRRIGKSTAIFGSAFLLFGIALTLSRTAWVGAALILIFIWLWRKRWKTPNLHWIATFLSIYFLACIYFVRWVPHYWGAGGDWTDISSVGSSTRPALWSLFLDAAKQQPLFGYGWNQGGLAHIHMALSHPPLHEYFQSAHNLPLDLVIWCGIPFGVAVTGYCIWWAISRGIRAEDNEDRILWLFLLIVANHSLLELPLHYAYFLLPVGLIIGLLDARMKSKSVLWMSWRLNLSLWFIATAVLVLLVRDYSEVEKMYARLRYQWAGIQVGQIKPPEVLLLTQWRDFYQVSQSDSARMPSDDEMQLMKKTVYLYPNTGFFQLLAIGWARRNEPEKAAQTLEIMCSILPNPPCKAVQAFWVNRARFDPVIAAVPWPRNR